MSIVLLCMAFCLLLTGCSAAGISVSGQAELQATASGQEMAELLGSGDVTITIEKGSLCPEE